jgi:hypothetical protein
MTYKKLGFGLGVFSVVLGAAELFAGRRIAAALGAPEAGGLVRAFGGRELAAGAGLLANPAHGALVWGRVGGDAMDLTALGLAARKSPRNALVWGAIASVAAVTALDVVTALGLDRTTGKTLPTGEEAETPGEG